MTSRARPELRLSYDEAGRVLAVAGELDIGSAPILREALLKLLADEEAPDLVLDATGVTFADSSGLAVLLMAARRWKADERRLTLRPSAPLDRIIRLTGARPAFTFDEPG